jgi:uncharacterized membrane protein YphA (DoxX/SURF4 family)
MKEILSNKYLQLAARLFVGFVFIYAAIGKIADAETFAKEIFNYHILPDYLINIIALVLPWLELIVGIFLIAGIRIRASATIASISMLVFIIAVLSAMFRGLDINCGCFADKVVIVSWHKVLEDSVILFAALLPAIFTRKAFTLENLSSD